METSVTDWALNLKHYFLLDVYQMKAELYKYSIPMLLYPSA